MSNQLSTEEYYKRKLFEYSDGKLIYMGKNSNNNAPTAAIGWSIWKFSYSGDDIIGIEGPLIGAWDDRATLDWS